ncbi:MAG: hypothetical protein DWI22_20170 [Planctomycetota bacterium]|nr:MAG: hypothetical protein DWI22_20170 [Planctomycetota bacterium]
MIAYYQDDNCTIYNASCETILTSLDRFDLLLTEPPKYPPGLTDDNKLRMVAGLKIATQSTRIGRLPEAGLQLAIELCDNAIVWQPDRYKLAKGKTLSWVCKGHIATAWHNIVAPRMMCWGPIPKLERVRLYKQCIHVTPKADTILDPFMDTGDVLIAAIRLHRKFVGIEIDKQRCDHAINRIFELKNPGS